MSDEPAYSSWYRAGHSVTADCASMRDRKLLANDRANIEAFLKQNEVLTQCYSTTVDALRGRLASAGVQHNLIDRIADEVASRFREWKITGGFRHRHAAPGPLCEARLSR